MAQNIDIYKWLVSVSKKEVIRSVTDSIHFLDKSHEYRTSIFIRDNLICQICGIKCRRKKLFTEEERNCPVANADHIYPIRNIIIDLNITQSIQALVCPEFWDLDNGRTLCEPCHRKTPTYGGHFPKFSKA